MALFSDPETQKTIENELEIVKKTLSEKLEGSEIISCHPVAVNIRITRTKFKSVVVLLQFSEKYPTSTIIVELKSKTLPPRLLAKMTELCDQEAKKFLGKPQVIPMLIFVRRFLDENPLIACSDELHYVKTKLLVDTDQLKVKQKAGVLNIRANQDKYYLDMKITVPDDYHTAPVGIELRESNFPGEFSGEYLLEERNVQHAKQTIYHDRWKVTPKLAEERWAHHEAKKRELSE
ncbi:hypothetical protein OS493_011969, partial [Desmophyllum pertusum]